MLVEIAFNTPTAARGIDEQNNLAQKYMIKGPPGSILSPKKAECYGT